MSLLLLTLFLVLAMNTEMALAFSCTETSALAQGLLDRNTKGCDVLACSSGSFCPTCGGVPGQTWFVDCYDGCSYCGYNGSVCVERQFSMIQNIDVGGLYGITHTFTKGANGKFEIAWDALGNWNGACRAAFLGQFCTCEMRYCDDSHQLVGAYANCTGITGGALYNGCLPDYGMQLKDDMIGMEYLVLLPYKICEASNNQTSAQPALAPASSGAAPIIPTSPAPRMPQASNMPASDAAAAPIVPTSPAPQMPQAANMPSSDAVLFKPAMATLTVGAMIWTVILVI